MLFSSTTAACPSYTDYSQVRNKSLYCHTFFSVFVLCKVPHGPFSTGSLALPYMRPDLTCRTFTSNAVEVGFSFNYSNRLSTASLESHTGHEGVIKGP